MIAVAAHGLEDFAQALVFANVVADEIGFAHHSADPTSTGGRKLVMYLFGLNRMDE